MVHRLDKETSGIVVLARNIEAHRALNASFRERRVVKIYHGLVSPVPNWRENQIDFPLSIDADRKHRTRVDTSNGKPALTHCKVSKWFPAAVLMEIQIFTGITHQIRAHLRVLDFALIGDSLYAAGLPPQPFEVPRTMLHARKLSFAHPRSGKWLSFTAPYPEDFRDAYTQLKTTTSPDAAI
jgi:RluA family pseudouridine synthase